MKSYDSKVDTDKFFHPINVKKEFLQEHYFNRMILQNEDKRLLRYDIWGAAKIAEVRKTLRIFWRPDQYDEVFSNIRGFHWRCLHQWSLNFLRCLILIKYTLSKWRLKCGGRFWIIIHYCRIHSKPGRRSSIVMCYSFVEWHHPGKYYISCLEFEVMI